MFVLVKEMGFKIENSQASMTGGLVQEYEHAILPSISPTVTFVLTIVSMVPALLHLWYLGADVKYRGVNFVR